MNQELIQELKKACVDEWYAFIQYITGASIATGCMRESIAKDLRENAFEELDHLEKLMERIQQLGALPPVDPNKWPTITNCGIIVPRTTFTIQLVKDSLEAEICAIDAYRKIANLSKELNDHVTYDIIVDILEDEEKHKFEMETFLKDFKSSMEYIQKLNSL